MTAVNEVVFLLGVGNTPLDNNRFAVGSGAQLFMKSWHAPLRRIVSKRATRADCRSQEPRR